MATYGVVRTDEALDVPWYMILISNQCTRGGAFTTCWLLRGRRGELAGWQTLAGAVMLRRARARDGTRGGPAVAPRRAMLRQDQEREYARR